jgi:hypothetical protein
MSLGCRFLGGQGWGENGKELDKPEGQGRFPQPTRDLASRHLRKVEW